MKHPSGYYVKYMLADSWNEPEQPLTLEAVNLALEDMGLPPVTEKQWEYLLSTFSAPPEFHFNNLKHEPTIKFMRKEKIYNIWSPTEDVKRVLDMMSDCGDRRYQDDLHILLMGDVPSEVIAEKLSRKYRLKTSITSGMVEAYAHYFWRVKSLTKKEWAAFLRNDEDSDKYLAALYCGEKQALFRAGLNPKYDYKQSLRDSHRQISFRIEFLGHKSDGKMNMDLLTKLTREQRALYDKLFGEGGGFEEQVKEVRRFIMQHKETGIKSFADLLGPGGSYSGDGSEDQKKQANVEEGDDDAGNADA